MTSNTPRKVYYETTTYEAHKAVYVSWAEAERVLGEPHDGQPEQDEALKEALIASGAPKWVCDAEGWVDEAGWGLYLHDDEWTLARIKWLLQCARNSAKTLQGHLQIEDITVHPEGYGEPGYASDVIVVLGNWNPITRWNCDSNHNETLDSAPSRLGDLLEKLEGVEIDWSDEYVSCMNCQKLLRSESDSYDWQLSYAFFDGETICCECLKNDSETMAEYLRSREGHGVSIDVNLEEYGYHAIVSNLQRGLHADQDADPGKIANLLAARGVTRVLLRLDEQSQFYSVFSVYVHQNELEKVGHIAHSDCMGPSVSEAFKRGLQQARVKMDELPGKRADLSVDG